MIPEARAAQADISFYKMDSQSICWTGTWFSQQSEVSTLSTLLPQEESVSAAGSSSDGLLSFLSTVGK